MELLKALIALGGNEVPAHKFIDILWAEPLEGDEQKAFEITVHRLRKLLGHEKAIQVSDRRVTLMCIPTNVTGCTDERDRGGSADAWSSNSTLTGHDDRVQGCP